MALETSSAAQAAAAQDGAQGEVIVVEDLWKTYTMGLEQQVNALCGITMSIRHNEYVAIMGPSGFGQIDADESDRLPGHADARENIGSTATWSVK